MMLSHKPIQNMVCQNAVDTILLTQESLRPNHWVYVSIDKGNKKRNKNLSKYIFRYSYIKVAVKAIKIGGKHL